MSTEKWMILGGVSAASFVISTVIAGWLLVRIPPNYFQSNKPHASKKRPLWQKILKNAGGVLLMLLGLVMSIPGVPGQGLLMVLAGLMLLDVPGKYKVERKILSLRPVRAATNRLRAWRGRPPLEFPRS